MSSMSAPAGAPGAAPAAANPTLISPSFISFLAANLQQSPKSYFAVTVALLLAVFLSRFGPDVDPREPPALKPTIPIVGHLVGLMRKQATFHIHLNKDKNLPIATLPILNGKMYAIWDPALIQAAFRNKDLAFTPIALMYTQKEAGIPDEVMKTIEATPAMTEAFAAHHSTMTGAPLHRMNRKALTLILNDICGETSGANWVNVPNFYQHIRDLLTRATSESLYGPANPIRGRKDLRDDLWTLSDGMFYLYTGLMPSWTAAKSIAARGRLQAAITGYYLSRGDRDPAASPLVREGAEALRRQGISEHDIARVDLTILHVSLVNTYPTLYWFVLNVFSRPGLAAQLRQEVAGIVTEHGSDVACIDITRFDKACPLLLSVYNETLRLYNINMGARRVMRDTTLSDGAGRAYLLKQGTDITFAAGSTHTLEQVWGPDALVFQPDRFLAAAAPGDNKAKKAAFHAFGGGRHLCPGRNFAQAENLGLVAAWLMGFELEPLRHGGGGGSGGWTLPQARLPATNEAVLRPVNDGDGFGLRIRRRAGWESTKWVVSEV